MRTVGEVSELAGVTVRTLHHYDEIGLLRPSGRSEAGYRLYAHADLERLQEILVWRQLGFSLTEVQGLLDDPSYDRGFALRRQRELVELGLERLGATARALDEALAAHDTGTNQKEMTMFKDFDPTEYEDETRERWGHTDAYQESSRRAASYDEAEWSTIRAEAEQQVTDFAALMAAGEPADGEQARAVAERHRQHITQWFYPVSVSMHRNLAELYVGDPRYGASYDGVAQGLAAYVREAILANADARPQDETISR
ncbi:MAG: MerR family transcriptional regulator [Solirubrobacteraceae bacterium]